MTTTDPLDEILDDWLGRAKGFQPSDSSIPAEEKTRHITRAEAKAKLNQYIEERVKSAKLREQFDIYNDINELDGYSVKMKALKIVNEHNKITRSKGSSEAEGE